MKDVKCSLAQEDVDQIAAAFSNSNQLVGAKTLEEVVEGKSFFLCEIEDVPSMMRIRDNREWCFIDERLNQFDPLAVRPFRTTLFGLVQMDASASEAEVLARIEHLGLDVCDFGDLLSAVLDPKDHLRGQPVIALGTTLVDDEGHRLHPRHNYFWAGERTLYLEYENTCADNDKKYMATKEANTNAGITYHAVDVRPDGFPPQYRFLVKPKTLS